MTPYYLRYFSDFDSLINTDSDEQTNRNKLIYAYIQKIYDLIDKIISIWNRNAEEVYDEDSEYEPECLCRFELTIGDTTDIYYLDEGIDDIYNIYDIDDLKKKIRFIITQDTATGDYDNIPIYLNSFDFRNSCKKVWDNERLCNLNP